MVFFRQAAEGDQGSHGWSKRAESSLRNALTRRHGYGNGDALDPVDVRILRELLQGQATAPVNAQFRKSYESIAKRVGVSEETVRNRVKGYHRSGFIKDWRTIVNPTVIQAGEVVLWIDVNPPTSKDDVVEKIRLMPGVILIGHFYGTLLGIVLRYYDENAVSRQIELIRRVSEVDTIVVAKVPFPRCLISLGKTDWGILRAIQREPRKPCAGIATELGLSSRTVKRRMQRMIDEAAIFGFPSLNPRAAVGAVMATLLVTYSAEDKQEVDEKIGTHLESYLWHTFHMLPYRAGDPCVCGFNLILPHVGDAEEILRWARRLPGILGVRIELCDGMETLYGPLDEEIERGIAPRSVALAIIALALHFTDPTILGGVSWSQGLLDEWPSFFAPVTSLIATLIGG
jgi:DNA-binding Lrp family transcriptional regulator